MAATNIHYVASSCRRIENSSDSNSNDFQCNFMIKCKVKMLEKEMKSLAEIINILRDDIKTVCAKRLTSRQLHTL